jgi:hypothetical protein
MSTIDQAAVARTPLGSDLKAGVEAISAVQQLTFRQYNLAIVPLDGYKFWVASSPAVTFLATGSFHYATTAQQDETETFGLNNVVFTSEDELSNFNLVSETTLWICQLSEIMFAFGARGSFYKEAELFHYTGIAIYPDMATQVVANSAATLPTQLIVSNSLPLWLALNGYTPPNPGLGFACPVTLYPSFLLPSNIEPPFASVHVMDETTTGLMSAPLLSQGHGQSHDQLVTEQVRITMFGLRNAAALTLLDAVNAYSLNFNTFGIMNVPIIRDEKRMQPELSTLAQKKSIIFEISYYQSVARTIAIQQITKATVAASNGFIVKVN